MRVVLVGCVLAGCGRFGFDLAADATGASDAQRVACPLAGSVPDPLVFMGQTFRYTNFDNTHTSMANVTVAAVEAGTGLALANTTSDGAGAYSLSIPTGGLPRAIRISYLASGFFTSTVVPGQPLDRSLTGASQMLWELGDAPLWNPTAMTAIYDTVMLARLDTHGTINVAIRTCTGASIPGVVVTVDPPPNRIAYTTTTGIVSTTSTQSPHSHAIAFNAQAGPTRINAAGPGLLFPEITVDVASGTNNTLVLMHPFE